tara:strand:+ start:112 stop:522 length:411 start_codon:yes stop_codon:yes gene_type:complete
MATGLLKNAPKSKTSTGIKPFPQGVATLRSNAPSSLVITYEGDTTSQTPVMDKILEDVTKRFQDKEQLKATIKLLTEFEALCRLHDWTYAYSDDHRYWVAGEKSIGHIRTAQNRLENDPQLKDFGREIYTHYCVMG